MTTAAPERPDQSPGDGTAGSLTVSRTTAGGPAETFIRVGGDGAVTAYNGHVDLGTGIRTALTQIVAEELDVATGRVAMVLGDTARTPNQGATIASETIQVTAVPLRSAAAQARAFLVARAAERLDQPSAQLVVDDGLVRASNNRSVSYGELIGDATIRLELDESVAVKPVDAYRIVGESVPRVDIAAKAVGEAVYVHDVRVPGMLHGRVVRPPYAGIDAGAFIGNSLLAIDEASISHIPGIVAVVRIADFVGVVAEREENAIRAAEQLKVTWKTASRAPDIARHRDRAARQPLAAAHPDRQGRRGGGDSRRRHADDANLCLALPACTPRSGRPARSPTIAMTACGCGRERRTRTFSGRRSPSCWRSTRRGSR